MPDLSMPSNPLSKADSARNPNSKFETNTLTGLEDTFSTLRNQGIECNAPVLPGSVPGLLPEARGKSTELTPRFCKDSYETLSGLMLPQEGS
ncbi:MAG: hypothetical protein WAX69_25160 [Victivallales bacterium]